MKNKKTLILKILILLTAIVTGLGLAARTQAADVTDYTQQTSITKAGVPLTSDSTVMTHETLSQLVSHSRHLKLSLKGTLLLSHCRRN